MDRNCIFFCTSLEKAQIFKQGRPRTSIIEIKVEKVRPTINNVDMHGIFIAEVERFWNSLCNDFDLDFLEISAAREKRSVVLVSDYMTLRFCYAFIRDWCPTTLPHMEDTFECITPLY